jgi:hypothetical protein
MALISQQSNRSLSHLKIGLQLLNSDLKMQQFCDFLKNSSDISIYNIGLQ